MKHLFLSVVKPLAVLAVVLCALPALALEFDSGNVHYLTTGGTTVTATGLTSGVNPTEIVIPQEVTNNGTTYKVTMVSSQAFFGNTTLQSVDIAGSVEIIGQRVFQGCSSLSKVTLHDGTLSILDFAFAFCPITEIYIPKTVKEAYMGVFLGCGSLTTVEIPGSLKIMGIGMFESCPKLTNVIIDEGVENISQEAFYDTPIAQITIPASVTTIGSIAFGLCYKLREITALPATPPTVAGDAFKNLDVTTITLKVPSAAYAAYKSAEVWKDFTNIVTDKVEGPALSLGTRQTKEKVPAGQEFGLSFAIANTGTVAVSSFSYSYTCGPVAGTGTCTLETQLQPGDDGMATLYFNALPVEGEYTLNITITNIDGVEIANPETNTYEIVCGENLVMPDDAVPFAYFENVDDRWPRSSGGGGENSYKVAMHLKEPFLVGKKVVGMTVSSLPLYDISKMAGWLSMNLGQTPDVAYMKADPEQGNLTVVFKEPYELTADGIWVGYDMTSTYTSPVPTAAPYGLDETLLISVNGSAFTDLSASWGCASITAYITGDFKHNAVGFAPFDGNCLTMPGDAYTLPFTLVNDCMDAITSIDYTYVINGKTVSKTTTVDLAPQIGSTATFTLDMEGLPSAGLYPLTITITKVNGVDNASNLASIVVPVQAMSFRATNRPLMEEATGTWCQWCTRGWLGMKLLNEQYPDFVGVAWHNDDPMTITNDYPMNFGAGFPGASINRTINELDPYYGVGFDVPFGISDIYEQATQLVVGADIDLATSWNANRSKLAVETTVNFAGQFQGYKLGYILGENGYCHPDEGSWAQANAYAGSDQTGDLAELAALSNPIKGLTFDDVVIYAKDARGVDNSLPTQVEAGKTYTHSYELPTVNIMSADGEYVLTEDTNQMFVVAMLIDPNGKVMTSRKVMAGNATTTAIGDLYDSDSEQPVNTTYFDLYGRRVSQPAQGFYLKVDQMDNGAIRTSKVVK